MTTDCVCPLRQTACGDTDCPRIIPTSAPRPRRTDLREMPAWFREHVMAERAARRAVRQAPTEQERSE